MSDTTRFYTVEQATEVLGTGRVAISRLVDTGQIQTFRIGTRLLPEAATVRRMAEMAACSTSGR